MAAGEQIHRRREFGHNFWWSEDNDQQLQPVPSAKPTAVTPRDRSLRDMIPFAEQGHAGGIIPTIHFYRPTFHVPSFDPITPRLIVTLTYVQPRVRGYLQLSPTYAFLVQCPPISCVLTPNQIHNVVLISTY